VSAKPEAYDQALDRAARHARSWLASLPDRPVPPRLTATARLLADGVTWMSGSRWRGREVMRVSVSNWSTDDADVAAAVDAVRRAAAG
jgi:hypothetical protein